MAQQAVVGERTTCTEAPIVDAVRGAHRRVSDCEEHGNGQVDPCFQEWNDLGT